MRPVKVVVSAGLFILIAIGVLYQRSWVQAQSSGSALQFNGSNQYVTFGAAPGLGASTFTIEVWFKRTGTGATTTTGTGGVTAVPLLTKGRGEAEGTNVDMNYFLGIRTSDNVLVADFEDNPGGGNHPVAGITAITSDVWHHAAATYGSNTWTLYLDGVVERTLTVGAFTPRSDSIQHAALATAMTSTGVAAGFFQGVLDEARVWNIARTQAQIASGMNQEITTSPGLIGRWGLNEGLGFVASDSSGSGVNGTLTNGPTWVDTAPPGVPTNVTSSPGNALATIVWNPVTASDLAGYHVYRGLTPPVSTVGAPLNGATPLSVPIYTDRNLTNGTPYYYVVVTVDTTGNKSAASTETVVTPDANAGAALQFSASSQYVTFGQAPSLGTPTFTLETWFKRTGAGAGTNTGSGGIGDVIPLISKGRAETEGGPVDMNYIFGIQASTHLLIADFEDTATGLNHPVAGITTIPVSTTTWHHAAATYDGTTWRLYLDGQLEKTLAVGSFTPRFDSIQHAAIATAMNSTGVASGSFAGIQDEVRIWNYARTAEQIQSTMHQEILMAPGLIGRYGLNEATGASTANTAGAIIPGTLVGTPGWVAGYPFTPDATPPDAPQNLTATPGAGTISLSWSANTEADLGGYNVYRSMTTPVAVGVPLNGSPLTTNGYIDNAVSNGATYYYVVTAVDIFGNASAPSNEANATPAAPNQPPTVNAGADQAIALPAVASLAGTAIDPDSYPAGLAVAWSKFSGPGTVGFTNANAASTTATFSVAGTYVLRLSANDGAATVSDDVTVTVSDPILVGAGDIAPDCAPGQSPPTAEAVAALLDGIPGTIFTLGDNAYQDGTATQFANCYGPTWGRHKARTRPATGNHDYHTANASAYFDYFNGVGNQDGLAGDRSLGYYSYDIGNWHVVVLNSECAQTPASPLGLWQQGGCAAGSAQEQWLRADLAASATNNIIAMWHKPRFSSTSTDATNAFMQPIWQVLYEGGADIVLGGHWHNYERLAPTDANGQLNTAFGIRQFVVGTGGIPLGGFGTARATSEMRNSNTHGVLKLTLRDDSYDWQFVPIAGGTLTDSGSSAVHGAPPPPAVSGITPAIGPAAGGTTVTIAGSGFGTLTPTSVTFGSTPATNVSCSSNTSCTATSPPGAGVVDVRVTVGGQTSAIVAADRFTYNQTPSVAAGPDQIVAFPQSATMAGSASDDGVPNPPGALSTAWSQVSGPGTSTFAVPSSPTTSVTFSAAGTYVLRFSGNDGLQSATDDVTINVTPGAALATGVTFNGTSQYVTFGAAPGLGVTTFTLELWFKRAGAGVATSSGSGGVNAEPLLTKGRAQAEGSNVDMNYFLGIDPVTRHLVADFEDMATGANHPVAGTTLICDDVWYHAAATYNGTTWQLYLNGALEATLVANATPRSDSIQHAGIGTAFDSNGAAAGFFDGTVDEARVWNVARSVSQIAGSMGSEVTSASGLIGRWGFSEGFGTAAVDSLGINNGTLVAGPVWVSGSPFAPLPAGNYGVDLSGTSTSQDYVTFGAAPGLGAASFTIETWFKRDGDGIATSTGAGGVVAIPLVTKGMAENDGSNVDMNYFLGIRASDSILVADFEDSATGLNHPVFGVTPITSGVWHHAAAAYANGTWTLYLDGVIQTTLSVGASTPRADSIQHAALGTALNSTGGVGSQTQGLFDGSIDEARIWGYGRTASQISGGMSRPITSAAGLLGRWSFDGLCTGGGASDSSGNGIHGTLNGSGWRCTPGGPVTGATNQAPVVDAGANQTITLPASANLNAIVSDDGVATPLTVLWTVVSGPGTVTFGTPNGASTTASFSAPGSYVLQIAVGDSELSSTHTVTVTANASGPVNQAPVVNAGLDQTVVLPSTGTLSGQVTDDGLPGVDVTTTWSAISGPGTVTFADSTSSSTTATFSAAGSYVLQLSANDGTLTGSDTVAITVVAGAAGNNAIDFAGTNSYVTFGQAPGLGSTAFTLELWFKREGPGTTADTGSSGMNAVPLVSKGRAQTDGSNVDMNYFFGLEGTLLAADFEEGASGSTPGLNHPIRGTTTIQNNTWYHAAATYDGLRWRLYLNGALDGELTVGQPPRADSIQHAAIASALTSTGSASGFFDGVVDEVRIWNYARTEQQIQETMNVELPSAAGLLGRWALNEASGTSVVDSSGNNITGTVVASGFARVPGTSFRANQAPLLPTLNAPQNNATDVTTSPTLSVGVSDPDGDPLSVTFFGRSAATTAAPDFTIVALPDTQHYSDDAGRAATFTAQTQWIVNNRSPLNVAFVTHLGDIVEHIDSVPEEWVRANTSLSLLDANNMKWGLAPGNHDMNSAGVAAFYDQYFPVSRFEGNTWYGGYLGKDPVNDPINRQNKDNYELFSVGGLDFIILHIEYDWPDYAVAWADRILKQFPTRRAILTTHLFLNASGARPTTVLNRPNGTPAETVWQQLIRTNCNVFLVLNGHYPGEANRTDLNACGQPVHQLASDYQSRTNGGDGWLRYMTFKPAENRIFVYTYSPTLNGGAGLFETDANSQFVLDYAMQGVAFSQLAANNAVPSGTNTTAMWSNLANAAAYDWFVTVNDGVATTTSQVWRFTTSTGNAAPVVTSPGDQSSAEGANVSLQIQATDDGSQLTYSALGLPGGLSINSTTGLITGTVAFGAAATNNVSVSAFDGSLTTSVNFVWSITRTNRAPVANPQSVTTAEDTAKSITLTGSDADADALTFTVLIQPAQGTLSGIAPNLTFTPAANYNGPDSFTFRVSDGTANSTSATVSITIGPLNDAPVANAQAVLVTEDTPRVITLTASDADANPLTFSIVTQPTSGTLSGTAPDVTYTPAANFIGSDSFSFRANDGTVDSNVATVSITVSGVNDPPVASNDSYTVDQGTVLNTPAPGVLANDADGDSVTVTAAVVTGPVNGTLTLNANGSFAYTPAVTFSGMDSFTYRATDGSGFSNVATVTVTVAPVPVQFRAAAFAQNGGSASITMAKPPAAAVTDAMIASIAVVGSATVTPPDGWTPVFSTGSGTLRQLTYLKIATGTEPTSYVWTFTAGMNASGGIVAYSGVDTDHPIDNAGGQLNGSSVSIVAPSIVTNVTDTRLVGLFAVAVNASITPPSIMAERGEITAGKVKVAIEAADAVLRPSGNTGTRTATASNAGVNSGHVVALRPSTAPPVAPQPPSVLNASASESQVALTWSIAGGATSYNVYRSATAGTYADALITGVTSTGYTDTAVANGNTYFYVVRSVNAVGESINSSPEASAMPACAAIALAPAALATGQPGVPFSQLITASGGIGPYTFTAAGSLPSGLELSSAGSITGTPATTGSTTFTVTATDSKRCTGFASYTIVVQAGCAALTITPVSLPEALLGTAYSQTLAASGGPATFAVTAGSLPNGLTLSATGVLSGTPRGSARTYTFTVTATIDGGCTGSKQYTLVTRR